LSCRDPHSFTDLEQGRITHMNLDLNVDFGSRRVQGFAQCDLAAPASGPLDMDTRDLDIQGVTTADGAAVVGAGTDRWR